jgi:hypothetical protein
VQDHNQFPCSCWVGQDDISKIVQWGISRLAEALATDIGGIVILASLWFDLGFLAVLGLGWGCIVAVSLVLDGWVNPIPRGIKAYSNMEKNILLGILVARDCTRANQIAGDCTRAHQIARDCTTLHDSPS